MQGQLLAAPPDGGDPEFARVVLLLIQHSPEQAFGVILNRRAPATAKELWKREVKKRCDFEGHANAGGPVPGPVMAVHTHQPAADLEVVPGVYYTVKKKNLDAVVRKPLIEEPGYRVKVFNSHAGWGPGQLDDLLGRGDWQVVPATSELIFLEEEALWKAAREA